MPKNTIASGTFQDREKFREAVACYQKALSLAPTFTGAYYNLEASLQDSDNLTKP